MHGIHHVTEHAAPGHNGVGLTQTTAFRVPLESFEFWPSD